MDQQTLESRKQFILQNIGKLKQVEIAKQLKISPAAVNQILRGRKRDKIEIVENGNFDSINFFKHYTY